MESYRLNQFLKFDAGIYFAENGNAINHKDYERPEQVMAYTHIRPDFKVLELGGRYGVVSCVVNPLLNEPKNHVVVEPDVLVHDALERNKRNASAQFQIYKGVVASPDKGFPTLVQNGSGSFINYSSIKDEDEPSIETCTFLELEERYNIKFNCLIADMEGGLADFLALVPDVTQFRLIMLERDRPTQCDYTQIHQMLLKNNFLCLVDGFHSCYINMNELPFIIDPKFFASFGTLGLEGTRGSVYDIPSNPPIQTASVAVPKSVSEYATKNGYRLHTVCAHANSQIVLTPQKKLFAFGFLQDDVSAALLSPDAKYIWKCNDHDVTVLSASELKLGIHPDITPIELSENAPARLSTLAISPLLIAHAHTAWAIFEPL